MTIHLAQPHLAWSYAKPIAGRQVADASSDGYTVEIYRASTGRITIRCYYWHYEQDISREGFLLDHRVSGASLSIAEQRARECGYPLPALLEAISAAEASV